MTTILFNYQTTKVKPEIWKNISLNGKAHTESYGQSVDVIYLGLIIVLSVSDSVIYFLPFAIWHLFS